MKTEWVHKKLGDSDVSKIIMGQSPSSLAYNEEGVGLPFLQGCAEFGDVFPDTSVFCADLLKIAPENSILMSVRAPVGAINKADQKYVIGRGLCSIVPMINGEFLYYYLLQNTHELELKAQGSTFLAINSTELNDMPVCYPADLSAQRRIAAILSSADKVIAATQKTIAKYKQIKQGMMEELLKPKEGWKMVKLGECSETELGKTLDEGRNTGQYRPYLCALNVLWGKIDTTTIKQMRIEDSELERYLVKKGDLLVCEGGEIGRCAIWNSNDEIYYQNALHRVRFYNEFEPMFFMYLLCFYNDLRIIEKYGKGLTIKHLNQTSFRNIPVYVPDLPAQRRIAAILSGIDAKIAAEEKVLEKYEKVKKGLMERMLEEENER